jgi:predicted SAM-dependent methyltransferase
VKLVNLGCGSSLHPDWINIDIHPSSPGVLRYDLLQGLPFENASVDVVYASHVLEHFAKEEGVATVKEIYRVLRRGGLARIVVPDLEQAARNYIECSEKVRLKSEPFEQENHKWAIIELLDQMVRQKSGGEMKKYWHQMELVNEDYIASRIGPEFSQSRSHFLRTFEGLQEKHSKPAARNNLGRRHSLRMKLLQKIFGITKDEFNYLMFRRAGELHKWMYDEISLSRLLQDTGFIEIRRADYSSSAIPNWEKYRLLDSQDDAPRKPDSLFMEARK